MKKPTSFLSEHTCEYYLLAELIPFLSLHFEKVIPFYFWSTREGSSRNNLPTSAYKCAVIYPRRPKIIDLTQREIFVKFNESISPAVEFYNKENIPVFAGAPSGISIFDLQWQSSSYWFEIIGDFKSDYECLISDNKVIMPSNKNIKHINMKRIVTVLKASKPLFWVELIGKIKIARDLENRNSRFYYNGYKPIFVLVTE